MTAVDIDPVVVHLAREYMGFDEFRGEVVALDAHVFLNRSTEKYGAAVLDAFGADAPTFRLATAEAFEACRGHLDDDGGPGDELHLCDGAGPKETARGHLGQLVARVSGGARLRKKRDNRPGKYLYCGGTSPEICTRDRPLRRNT